MLTSGWTIVRLAMAKARRCPIHCYRPDMRSLMRQVMRYSGPRMLLRHPWATLRHWLS